MRNNIVSNSDSYKYTHHRMEIPGTTNVSSYFESRTGALFNKTVWAGLQVSIKEHRAPLGNQRTEQWSIDEVSILGWAGEPILFGEHFGLRCLNGLEKVQYNESCFAGQHPSAIKEDPHVESLGLAAFKVSREPQLQRLLLKGQGRFLIIVIEVGSHSANAVLIQKVNPIRHSPFEVVPDNVCSHGLLHLPALTRLRIVSPEDVLAAAEDVLK